jgi:bacterioferritin
MEIKVEEKNKKYAEILKKNYVSRFGDLTSFLLYKYETYKFNEIDHYFSSNMNKFSKDSLTHFKIIGRLISMLGGNPNHNGFSIQEIFYEEDKEKLLEVNIRLTKEKIIMYTNNMNEIEDKYINEILKNFIVEERKNLEILEMMQYRYKRERRTH